jgi:GINS complex subunit 3
MSRHLDIDLILSEEERLPCKFVVDAAYLGSLDPINTEVDLPAETKVELPLWMAQSLYEKNMVQLELPKHFGSRLMTT